MSVVTLQSDVRMHGRAELGFVRADGVDRLERLYQRAPLRVLFPDPPAGEPPLAALVTTSGGLAGGDRLELAVTVGEQARAVVMASAAEKIYRSTGPDTVVEVAARAESGATLEILPQETILFDGARLRRSTRLDAAAGARVLAGEMLVFGRTARGERLSHGLVRDAWELRRGGRLVWADALHLDDMALLKAPAGFGGAVAAASLVALLDDPAAARDRLRGLEQGGRFGATVVNGVLVARWLDDDARRLRRGFGAAWAMLRAAELGLAERMPRLWEI
jgi:urease accessory protein